MEPTLEELKAANLKLKLENENLQSQNENLKASIFQKDLFVIADELEIPISSIYNDDEFVNYLRLNYDKGGINLLKITIKQMLNIKDPRPPKSSYDMPPEMLKYLAQVEKNKSKNKY